MNMNPHVFCAELEFVNRAVEKKTTIPILAHTMIEQSKGICTLTGTDLEIGVVSAFPGDTTLLSLTAPASPLLRMITTLKGHDGFDMTRSEEGTKLLVRSGNFRASLDSMMIDSYPELPKFPKKKDCWSISIDTLATVLTGTSHAISSEEDRFTLNGSLLVLGKGFIRSIATDGHRLALAEIPIEGFNGGDKKLLLPRRVVKMIQFLSNEGDCLMGADENHVFFLARNKNGNYRSICCRKLTGNCPNYERVMPKKSAIKVTTVANRKELLKLVNLVYKSTDERSRAACLGLYGESSLHLTATGDHATSEMAVKTVGVGAKKQFDIGYNIDYVKECLASMDCEDVTLMFQDPTTAGMVKGTRENAAMTNVLMPLRLS